MNQRFLLSFLVFVVNTVARDAGAQGRTTADSVVLERTWCLGTCPIYRLVIHADGVVQFISRNTNDSGRVESARRAPQLVGRILKELERARFSALPQMQVGKPPYCRIATTDAPTIMVARYRQGGTDSVAYYTGCLGETPTGQRGTRYTNDPRRYIRRLLSIADSVDAISGAKAWIRPNRCCLSEADQRP